MNKYFYFYSIYTLILFGLITNSCNGQVKKDLTKEKVSESKKISAGPPKLRKKYSFQNDAGNNVHCSIQDKAGNLWFGTTGDGVYKYDGKSFTQYTTENGLNHNSVNHLLEDKDGKIWICTEAGVCFYDPRLLASTGSDGNDGVGQGKPFTNFPIILQNGIPSIKNDVFSMIQDKNGKLWFATINGICIYDARLNDAVGQGKSFSFFKVTDDTKDCYYKMEYILEDNAGNFWFGGRCNKGVFRYDARLNDTVGQGKTITHLYPNGDDWAWPVLQDKKGNIWFSSWKGAYLYDGKLFKKVEGLSDGPITRIIEDKKGNLWFGGGGRGICRYDGKTYTCFSTKEGLINNDVWSILEDKTGALWVGTRETILHRFDGKTFTIYSEYRH